MDVKQTDVVDVVAQLELTVEAPTVPVDFTALKAKFLSNVGTNG